MSDLIEELREEQVSRLEEKVEALTKEIHAIKNPPKKKSPLDGLTTYEKITKVAGEALFLMLPIYTIFYVLNEFFRGERGWLTTTILVSLSLWLFGGLWDIVCNHYGWKKKNT